MYGVIALAVLFIVFVVGLALWALNGFSFPIIPDQSELEAPAAIIMFLRL
jgi:hypothetical protein